MLSWKALSLVVAAAVAMNGVSGLEQGNSANVPKVNVAPSDSPVQSATLVPAAAPTASNGDSYSFASTGSSVAGSSAVDGSAPAGKGTFTIPPSTGSTPSSSSGSGSVFDPKSPPQLPIPSGSTSSSGSGSEVNPKQPPTSSTSGSGSVMGSQSEGSTGLDGGSGSSPKHGVLSLSGSGSSPAGSTGSTGSTGGSDYTTSNAGSAVDGSSAIDEGSDYGSKGEGAGTTPPLTGSGSVPGVPTGSEGSTGITEGSSSQLGSKGGDIEFPSSSGSETTGSADIGSSQSSGTGDGIPGSGSVSSGSGSVPSTSETGSQVAGSSSVDGGSDSNSPKQTAGSASTPSSSDQSQATGSDVAGSSASEPTSPGVKTSCKRHLRQETVYSSEGKQSCDKVSATNRITRGGLSVVLASGAHNATLQLWTTATREPSPMTKMSTSQLHFRRKIGDAQYGEVMECEVLPSTEQQQQQPSLTTQVVAVKCMSLTCAAHAQNCIGADRAVDDPQQECLVAELLAKSGGHPNVVRSYFHFREHAYIYLVSELCADGDLYTHVTTPPRSGAVDERTSIDIMTQIFAGVDFLHRQLNIAHRDLSLENVLMHDGKCKISDFGLSVDANSCCVGRVGKDYYMAPEVVAGEEYDPVKADVWSLGIMWFVMLTGSSLVPLASVQEKAFVGLMRCGVAAVFKSWKYDDKLSRGVIDLISCMLEVDPAERIALEDILTHSCLKGEDAC
uniref:Protein kinase domain-containing protein n=2 Tax=Phytophthora ramorum TaxID=164328 RepID=H3GYB0_PHYRM